MEKLVKGEGCELDNGKNYIVYSQVEYNGNDYVYLISNFTPVEIRFAKQYIEAGELKLELVTDSEEKQTLLAIFNEKNSE